jgi:hypothetical protein
MTTVQRTKYGLFLAALVGALLASILTGCSTVEVAEAKGPSRYTDERVAIIGITCNVHVVEDTETGERWMVAEGSDGRVAIEPMDGGDADV